MTDIGEVKPPFETKKITQVPQKSVYLLEIDVKDRQGEDLPTAETTMFDNPDIVQSAHLISQYLGAHGDRNKKDIFRRIGEFCSVPSKAYAFAEYAVAVARSIEELPEGKRDSLRVRKYQELIKRANDEIGLSVTVPRSIRPDFAPIPEQVKGVEIPEESLDIANAYLQHTYPQEFGKVIPKLRRQDIRVLSEKDFREYSRTIEEQAIHQLVRTATERVNRSVEGKPSVKQRRDIRDFAMMPHLPNKPIFFTDTVIKSLDEFSPQLRVAIIARWLSHENIHRATQQVIFLGTQEEYSNLVQISFSKDRFMMESLKDSELAAIYKEKIDQSNDYLRTHDGSVVIGGAMVSVRTEEEDGVVRLVSQSGYDLNEAITEYLIPDVVDYITDYLSRKGRGYDAAIFREVMKIPESTTASFQCQDLSSTVGSLLQKLGLQKRNETLLALCKGDIPKLYIAKFPNVDYYT